MGFIKKNSGLIFIFVISLLPVFNLLNSGLPITHDGLDHVVRIANFYKSLGEGNIVPRWAGNLNWGYGHPILMFLYPLPSYFTSILHFIDISYVNSLKIVFAVSYSLSGIFMYLWLSRFTNKYAAITGSVLYLFAPYRFVDIYVRGAIGEHVAFVFMPLILLGLFNIFNIKSQKIRSYYFNFIFTSVSFAFLVLSHNAISLLFIPFIIFYIFYLFLENRSILKIITSFTALFFGFLYSAFFWIPAFMEGKYTLRDIVIENSYLGRFAEFKDIIYGPWSYGGTGEFTLQLGIVQILIVISAILFLFKFFKSKSKQKYLLIGSLLFLFASIFLMLEPANFIWTKLSIIQKLQFPWRFLTMTTFCVSVIGAILIHNIEVKQKNLLSIFLIIFTIIPTITYWHAKEYKTFADNVFEKPYASTTDTGESAPIWSVRFMEKFPKANIEIIEGSAEIKNYKRNSTYHEYLIVVNEKTRLRENTLYFPGWKVYDNYKLIENIEFQDPVNRGLMTFYLDEGLHDVIIKFENTKIRKVSELISLISIITAIIFPIIFLLFPNLKIKKYKW